MTAALPIFDNAIAYAHFQLRGGWRNLLLSGGAYLFILLGAVWLIYSLVPPRDRTQVLDALRYAVLGLQVLLFLLYGLYTTGLAVKTDLSQRLIESHRLMALPSGYAIAGYLLGAPCQAYALFGCNIVVGLVLGLLVGASATDTRLWLLRNLVLFLFGLFTFAFTIFWGFLGRNVGRYLVGLSVVSMFTTGLLYAYLPSLYLLGTPFIHNTLFARDTEIDWIYGVSALGQAALSAVFLAAAVRRYRRPHLPAFTPPLGLFLLASFALLSVVGIYYWDRIGGVLFERRDVEQEMQFALSTLALMLLGILPIASAARLRSPVVVRHAGRPAPHPVLVALVASAVCLLLLPVSQDRGGIEPRVHTAVVVTAFLLSFAYLLTWAHTITTRPALIGLAWLLLTWGIPLLVDVVRYGIAVSDENAPDRNPPVMTTISTFSPLGAMLATWAVRRFEFPMLPGLVFQAVLAAFTFALAQFLSRRKREDDIIAPVPSGTATT